MRSYIEQLEAQVEAEYKEADTGFQRNAFDLILLSLKCLKHNEQVVAHAEHIAYWFSNRGFVVTPNDNCSTEGWTIMPKIAADRTIEQYSKEEFEDE